MSLYRYSVENALDELLKAWAYSTSVQRSGKTQIYTLRKNVNWLCGELLKRGFTHKDFSISSNFSVTGCRMW